MDLDEHLREALRHAPDRDAQPPRALSRAILDAAARARPDSRPGGGTSRRWTWLFSGLGAAAAAGVAALLIGHPGSLELAEPVVVARNEARSTAPAPVAQAPTPMAPAPQAESHKGEADAPAGTAAPAAPAAAGPVPAAVPEPAAAPAPAPAPARDPSAGDTAQPQAPAAPAPAPAADVQAPAGPAPQREPVTAAAEGPPPPAAETSAAAVPPPVAAPAAPAALARDRLMARADDADALRLSRPEQLRTRLVDEPGLWRWQAPGARMPRLADDAALAWLNRLLLHSAQHWEPHVGPLPAGETVPWLRKGRLEAEIRLADDGVLFRAAGGPALWQPMPAAALQDLKRRF